MHGSLSLRPALALGASLADQAYQLIKDDLFSFRLLPGERFTETDLAARLGVSRTPVRLGLARLEREGFVLASPRSFWQRGPSISSASRPCTTCASCWSWRRWSACARARGRADLLEALRDIWHAAAALLDGRRVAELDEAFHCALVEAAGNPEIAQVHRDVTEKIRIVRRLDFTKDFRIDATYEEHGAILSAVLARRADEAARLLRAHIGMSRAEVSKITLRMLHARGG